MEKIKNLISGSIEKIENINLSFWEIIFLIYTAIFFRTFLENYANSSNLHHMTGFIDTFWGYPAWFSVVFLSIFIIAKILTREKIEKIAKVITFFSFVILTPPIVDLIVNKGDQIRYMFITGTYSQIFTSFITYFGGGDIGIGIRTEVFIVLVGFGFYIFHKTKEIKRSLLGMFFLYSTIFITLIFPTLIFGIQNTITKEYKEINKDSSIDFYYRNEPQRTVTSSRTFVLEIVNDDNFYSFPNQKMINQYSITFAIIFLFINTILMAWYLFLYSPKKFFVVFKNFRYLRILHYFLMVSVGVYFGINMLGKSVVGSLFDLVSFISLYLALFFAWLFAVWENDEVDIEIDKISNEGRPLVDKKISFSIIEWKNLKFLFLGYSLSFAFLSGFYSFMFIIMFILIYHIYSAPPLHLKRFLGISSLLIAINALLAVWMGFFMSSGTANLNAFPSKYTFGILGLFFLVENVKNIKDIDGDRREGIKTIPVIFGEKRGKLIIGICLFISSLLVPIIFYFNLYTLILAIIFGSILFFLVNKKIFKENYIFITYFTYIIILMSL